MIINPNANLLDSRGQTIKLRYGKIYLIERKIKKFKLDGYN